MHAPFLRVLTANACELFRQVLVRSYGVSAILDSSGEWRQGPLAAILESSLPDRRNVAVDAVRWRANQQSWVRPTSPPHNAHVGTWGGREWNAAGV